MSSDESATELGRIIDGWEREGIRYVRFELPDLHGTARTKLVPVGAARDYARDGLNMYGGAGVLDSRSDVVGGMAYDSAVKYADQLLFPDPRSATVVPWEDATARFICRAHWDGGQALAASPRQVLERVLDVAEEMGYGIKTGAEYEFYLLNADRSPLFGGYHIFNHTRMHAHPVIRCGAAAPPEATTCRRALRPGSGGQHELPDEEGPGALSTVGALVPRHAIAVPRR